MPPVPKPQHNRRVPKRAQRTEFSRETKLSIWERDNGLCVNCFGFGSDIHHIEYRSSLSADVNTKRNGVVLCRTCHDRAHRERSFREWLRNYKETMLDEQGDIKLPFTDVEWEDENE